MKQSARWARNVLLAMASFGISLVVAELAIRWFAPQPTGTSHQDRYGLAMHYPGITRYLPQFGHEVSFNEAGMRDREHKEKKPAGVYRILLLGDSFMEAVQVPFELSFASLLENQISALNGKQVEVVNAGVSGWGTADELRYFRWYGRKYDPDLIVVAMTLHNDISDNLREEWHTLRDGQLVEKAVEPMPAWTYRKTQLKAFIATRFQLYQLWRKVRHGGEMRQVGRALNTHVTELFVEPEPLTIARGLKLTEHLLTALRDTASAAGQRVAVVMLPIRYQLSDSLFAHFSERSQATGRLALYKPQNEIAGIAARIGIPVIDLLPAFRKHTAQSDAPLFLEWDGHWNAAGHKLSASVVARALSEGASTGQP